MKRILITVAVILGGLVANAKLCHAGGNVTVGLSEEGVLSIQGDAEGNFVRILAADNVITIQSLYRTGTLINGEAALHSTDRLRTSLQFLSIWEEVVVSSESI